VSPRYGKAQTEQRKRTDHHLIALFCTVAGNGTFARWLLRENFNEINDLERGLDAARDRKSF
jgi:hypothetical protein